MALQSPKYHFEEMAGYLDGHMPQTDYTPLGPGILLKDAKYNDYQDVSWHLLLARDKSAFLGLNITKSEIVFFKKFDTKSIRISCFYDINSFVSIINTLVIYTYGFLLAYHLQFLGRIT